MRAGGVIVAFESVRLFLDKGLVRGFVYERRACQRQRAANIVFRRHVQKSSRASQEGFGASYARSPPSR
jgi:hypothetical protein